MRKKRALVFALCVFLLPAAAQGQGVRWESAGKVEFGGALGLIAGIVGGGDVVSTYALQDGRWLIDSESSGTVYDYREGNFTAVDHESRSYFTTSFADMAQAVEARAAEARERVEEARAEAGDETPMPEPDEDPSEVNLGVNISVDRHGDRREIAGYDAERFIVTVEIGGEVATEEGTTVLPGTMVLLSDVWTSRDFPADRLMREMFEEHPEWADLEDLREAGAGLQEAFALDGRIKLAMEEGAAKLEEVGGHSLLSRMSVVLVPEGAELDLEAVFAAYERDLGLDVKGAAAGAVKEAAGNAVRGALGRFGLGRKEEKEETAESDPTQAIVMRITDRVTAVVEGDLPPETFLPPQSYEERVPEWLTAGVPH